MTIGFILLFSITTFAQSKNLDKWLGTYSYVEKGTVKIQNVTTPMVWGLVISKSANGYSGKLSIEGYQTFVEDMTDITGNDNTISIRFVKQTDGPVYDYGYKPKPGDVLLTLSKVKGKILTRWVGESTRLDTTTKKICRCFVLEKR